MSKRKSKRRSNKIMKAIALFMGVIFALSCCCVDAEGWIAEAVCFMSVSFLAVYVSVYDLGGDC